MNITFINFEYYSHWKKYYKYRESTQKYKFFLKKISLDKSFKRKVDLFISMNKTESEQQKEFENTLNYSLKNK